MLYDITSILPYYINDLKTTTVVVYIYFNIYQYYMICMWIDWVKGRLEVSKRSADYEKDEKGCL